MATPTIRDIKRQIKTIKNLLKKPLGESLKGRRLSQEEFAKAYRREVEIRRGLVMIRIELYELLKANNRLPRPQRLRYHASQLKRKSAGV